MKQVDVDQEEEQMSADYLLLHTAFKAGEQQRRRQTSLTVPGDSADRRQSVPRIHVDDDGLDHHHHHHRSHSLKCSSSSSPAARRQSCRRAGSVRSTPPRATRNNTNPSPKVQRTISNSS